MCFYMTSCAVDVNTFLHYNSLTTIKHDYYVAKLSATVKEKEQKKTSKTEIGKYIFHSRRCPLTAVTHQGIPNS